MIYAIEDFSCLTQRAYCKEVGGYQKQEYSGIIRRTEGRSYQTNRLDGSTPTIVAHGVELAFCTTHKTVTAFVLLALLVAESLEDILDGIYPSCIEYTGIARYFPILVSQTDRVAQGVDFPFALMQLIFHVGHVALPFTSARDGFHVEGISEWVDVDAGKLTVDDTCHHLFQMSILIG